MRAFALNQSACRTCKRKLQPIARSWPLLAHPNLCLPTVIRCVPACCPPPPPLYLVTGVSGPLSFHGAIPSLSPTSSLLTCASASRPMVSVSSSWAALRAARLGATCTSQPPCALDRPLRSVHSCSVEICEKPADVAGCDSQCWTTHNHNQQKSGKTSLHPALPQPQPLQPRTCRATL